MLEWEVKILFLNALKVVKESSTCPTGISSKAICRKIQKNKSISHFIIDLIIISTVHLFKPTKTKILFYFLSLNLILRGTLDK